MTPDCPALHSFFLEDAAPSWSSLKRMMGSGMGAGSAGGIKVPREWLEDIDVPPDGNCLFSAMSVAFKLARNERVGVQDPKMQTHWGLRNRQEQVAWVKKQLGQNSSFPPDDADAPSLSAVITASSGLQPSQYCFLALHFFSRNGKYSALHI